MRLRNGNPDSIGHSDGSSEFSHEDIVFPLLLEIQYHRWRNSRETYRPADGEFFPVSSSASQPFTSSTCSCVD